MQEVPRYLLAGATYTMLLYASVAVARITSRQAQIVADIRLLFLKLAILCSRFSCPPSPLWVPAGHRYDPWGNERVADLTHEVGGRAAPQLAIVCRFGRS